MGAVGIEHVDEGAELGVERQRLGQRNEPVERLDADSAVPLVVERAQQLQARARQRDERLRVGPDVRLGGEQRRRAARRTRREALALDQHDSSEPGAGTEGCRREPDDAAADDEHVGAAVEARWDAGLEGGEHVRAGGVAPDGLPYGHDVRLCGDPARSTPRVH